MLKNLFHIGGNAAKEKYQKQISCLEILLYDFYLNLSLVSLLDFVKNKDGYIVYSLDNIHVNTIIIWMKCPFNA